MATSNDAQALLTFLVHAHFEVKAEDASKLAAIYADLETAGFHRAHQNSAGKKDTLPKGSAMGMFTGHNAGDVCAFARNSAMVVLAKHKVKTQLFVVAGEKCAWVSVNT